LWSVNEDLQGGRKGGRKEGREGGREGGREEGREGAVIPDYTSNSLRGNTVA